MAPVHYMTDEVLQFYYNEIKKPGSPENAVDSFWLNLLLDYFKKEDMFGFENEARLLPQVTKERADWNIRVIRNGSQKKVVLMEDNRRGYESLSSDWQKALDQLTRYLCLVRTEPGQSSEEVLYGAVNIGTFTRFYELHPWQPTCVNYTSSNGYNGEALELLKDEATIHRILTELVEKTKN